MACSLWRGPAALGMEEGMWAVVSMSCCCRVPWPAGMMSFRSEARGGCEEADENMCMCVHSGIDLQKVVLYCCCGPKPALPLKPSLADASSMNRKEEKRKGYVANETLPTSIKEKRKLRTKTLCIPFIKRRKRKRRSMSFIT
eukprot:824750-Pelagomonas_calceolata.AAC.3